MTVAIEDIKAGPYEGDGVKTEFDFDFKTLVDTDVAVYYLDVDEVQALLVKDTDYTITLNADQNDNAGGSITKLGAVLPAGEFLTLVNEPDFTQQVKIRTESFVKPSVMETMVDRVTLLAQRAKLDTARSLKMPLSWDDTPVDLPFPKAGNILMWNDALDGFKNVAATAVTILDRLQDADNDTKIWVEKTPDDDTIRFDAAGTERGDWTAARLRVQDILEIHSAGNTLSALHFGDPEDADVGRITYDHSGNVMRVWLAAGIKGRWNSTGLNIAGNDVAPDGPLHIGAGLAGAVTARTDGDDVIIEAADNAGVTLLGGIASRIWFGDAANGNNKGLIECLPGTPSLGLGLNSAVMLNIKTNEIVFNEPGGNQDTRMEGNTNSTVFFLDASNDHIVVGSSSGDASALLDMVSTTKALGLTTWTTTQRDNIASPRDGLIGHNSTKNTVDARLNGAWKSFITEAGQGALIPLASVDLSVGTITNLDFTSNIDGTYDVYKIFLEGFQPTTDNAVLHAQFYIGGVLQAGASDYGWSLYGVENQTTQSAQNGTDDRIDLIRDAIGGSMGNDANFSLNGEITIYHPANTALNPRMTWTLFYRNANSDFTRIFMTQAEYNSVGTAMDGIRFFWGSGDFAAGTAKLYGVRNP